MLIGSVLGSLIVENSHISNSGSGTEEPGEIHGPRKIVADLERNSVVDVYLDRESM